MLTDLPQCSWDRPGADRYTGSIVEAVERLAPQLRRKVELRQYDDQVVITRDAIAGKHSYDNLRDMHFGAGRVCGVVTRRWAEGVEVGGLVYCDQDNCLIIPAVCGNVARVTRRPPPAAGGAPGAPSAGAGGAGQAAPPVGLPERAPRPDVVQTEAPRTPELVRRTESFSDRSGWQRSYGPIGGVHITFLPPAPGPVGPPVPPQVPEPETWAMLAAGLAAVLWLSRRKP